MRTLFVLTVTASGVSHESHWKTAADAVSAADLAFAALPADEQPHHAGWAEIQLRDGRCTRVTWTDRLRRVSVAIEKKRGAHTTYNERRAQRD